LGIRAGNPVPYSLSSARQADFSMKKTSLQHVVSARFAISGRLDSKQRLAQPHSLGGGRAQTPKFANASLLETYRFHPSDTLGRSQPKITEYT
jgi:hypothetical protein